MTRGPGRLGIISLSLAVLGAMPLTVAGDDYVGTETCAVCHEEVAATLSLTSHAVAPGWDAERACESCHGPGGEHADSGGELDKIVRLGELPPRDAAEKACLPCHKRQEKQFTALHSMHDLGDVGCTDCHSPHSKAENMLERTGAALCGDCHQAIVGQFDMPRSHPGDDCSSCHEPHSTRSLRTSKPLFGETCTNCHFEKEGPFIYAHDTTIVDGCAGCHEVHGSSNRHLLKHEPQVNLCYQCHSANVTPSWHSANRFLNEKCTACHTAIHGSNTSPFFLEE